MVLWDIVVFLKIMNIGMKMFLQTLTEIGKMDHNFKDILHNVNLTEGQIGVILCALETSTKYADSDYIEEVDAIFQELEGTVDRFYNNMEKKKKQQPVAEWTD